MDFYFYQNAFHNVIDGEELPDGAVLVPRLPLDGEIWDDASASFVWNLELLKQNKRDAVKALRAEKENGTCTTPSGVVQIDDSSKIKINGLATLATISKANSQPFSIEFILADNSVATLDADAAITMSVAVGTYVSALYANSLSLTSAVATAADADTLFAIDITSGWPE